MKKLILLFFCVSMYAQNPTNFPYGIKNTVGTENSTPTYIVTSEVDGVHKKTPAALFAKTSDLDLKQTVFTGIDQKQFLTENDFVIDNSALTLTISTVKNGTSISYINPVRFFTDGIGIAVMHEKTSAVTFNFTNTTGIWYFYFNSSGNPIATQTPWTDFSTIAPVYRFYWNATLGVADRRVLEAVAYHKNDVSWIDRTVMHLDGAKWANGLTISSNAIASGSPATDGSNAVITLASGSILDDNLQYSITNASTGSVKFTQNLGTGLLPATSGKFICISNSAAGLLEKIPATDFPFLWNSGINTPEYLTVNGTRTGVTANYYFVYYVYALQDPRYGESIKIKSAEIDFANTTLAAAHNWEQLQVLFPTLRDPSVRLLYKLTFEYKTSYDVGTKKAALRFVDDLRKQKTTTTAVASGTVPATNVSVSPIGNISSTNAQSALEELDSEKENISNKSDSYTVSSSTTYASTKALVDGLGTKQNTLTNPITGTGTANYIPKFTGTGTLGDSKAYGDSNGIVVKNTEPTTYSSYSVFNDNGLSSLQLGIYNSTNGNANKGFLFAGGNTSEFGIYVNSIKAINFPSSGGIQIGSSNNATINAGITGNNTFFQFATSGVNRVKIDSTGELLVNTIVNNGVDKLQVAGSIRSTVSTSGGNDISVNYTSGASGFAGYSIQESGVPSFGLVSFGATSGVGAGRVNTVELSTRGTKDLTFMMGVGLVEAMRIKTSGNLQLTTTPTTSASTPDILTRNPSTGVIEKKLDSDFVHKAGVETISGGKSFTSYINVYDSVLTDESVIINPGEIKISKTAIESPAIIRADNVTDVRTIQLPNASGTIALVETVRPYKVYTALLSQSGTSAPTATVLENTLGGTIVWTRNSTGLYTGTLAGFFTANKTAVFITSTSTGNVTGGVSTDVNTVTIATNSTDSLLTNSALEIRVYN